MMIETPAALRLINQYFKKIEIMGLIREPKNVDFYVIDKPWTEEEQKEFSAFIKMRKEQRKKRAIRGKTSADKAKALHAH